MLRCNRLDLADRWLYQMRRSFAAGRSAPTILPLDALSTLGVIVARHEADV
jgi:hypothetical protein